jgi:hypothetical protein
MRLQLTETAKQELKVIYVKYTDDNDEFRYDDLTERELLLIDAELYVEEAYEDNEFDNLEDWCKLVQQSEYDPKYLEKHPNACFDKVSEMLKLNILELSK